MATATISMPGEGLAGARSRARVRVGARLIFQRCDGKPAGDMVELPRGRRPLLSALAKTHADRTRPHIVCVYRKGEPWAPTDFSVRTRKRWRHTRIGPNDTVAIIYAPRGSGGRGGGNRAGKAAGIGLLVATIALAALGQFWAIGALTPLVGGAGMAGTIWAAGSAALLAGAGYLLSRATQPKANKDDNNRPLYGVSGGGNFARLGDRIPAIYGRCWTTPDLSQPDYTIYEGDDQTLYKRMTIGVGRYSVKTMQIGETAFWSADEAREVSETEAHLDRDQCNGSTRCGLPVHGRRALSGERPRRRLRNQNPHPAASSLRHGIARQPRGQRLAGA